jgi:hypothetical protein
MIANKLRYYADFEFAGRFEIRLDLKHPKKPIGGLRCWRLVSRSLSVFNKNALTAIPSIFSSEFLTLSFSRFPSNKPLINKGA